MSSETLAPMELKRIELVTPDGKTYVLVLQMLHSGKISFRLALPEGEGEDVHDGDLVGLLKTVRKDPLDRENYGKSNPPPGGWVVWLSNILRESGPGSAITMSYQAACGIGMYMEELQRDYQCRSDILSKIRKLADDGLDGHYGEGD